MVECEHCSEEHGLKARKIGDAIKRSGHVARITAGPFLNASDAIRELDDPNDYKEYLYTEKDPEGELTYYVVKETDEDPDEPVFETNDEETEDDEEPSIEIV